MTVRGLDGVEAAVFQIVLQEADRGGEIPGTVARGFLKEDDPAFWYGIQGTGADATWITGLPHLREAVPYPRQINRLYP